VCTSVGKAEISKKGEKKTSRRKEGLSQLRGEKLLIELGEEQGRLLRKTSGKKSGNSGKIQKGEWGTLGLAVVKNRKNVQNPMETGGGFKARREGGMGLGEWSQKVPANRVPGKKKKRRVGRTETLQGAFRSVDHQAEKGMKRGREQEAFGRGVVEELPMEGAKKRTNLKRGGRWGGGTAESFGWARTQQKPWPITV